MGILHTLRTTLHPENASDIWALIGFFLWIFLTWCLHDKKGEVSGKKKTGWFKASVKALVIIIVIGVIVGKLS